MTPARRLRGRQNPLSFDECPGLQHHLRRWIQWRHYCIFNQIEFQAECFLWDKRLCALLLSSGIYWGFQNCEPLDLRQRRCPAGKWRLDRWGYRWLHDMGSFLRRLFLPVMVFFSSTGKNGYLPIKFLAYTPPCWISGWSCWCSRIAIDTRSSCSNLGWLWGLQNSPPRWISFQNEYWGVVEFRLLILFYYCKWIYHLPKSPWWIILLPVGMSRHRDLKSWYSGKSL